MNLVKSKRVFGACFTGSINMFSAKYSYADEYTGSTKSAWYLEIGVDLELPGEVGLGLHVGKSDGDAFESTTPGVASTDYVDYKVAVSKEFGGFGVELAFIDTDASGALETKSGAFANDSRVVLTVSKSM